MAASAEQVEELRANPARAQGAAGAGVILELLGALHDIEADARGARRKFQMQAVVNGRTTLRRIEERCQDAFAAVNEREDGMAGLSSGRFRREQQLH